MMQCNKSNNIQQIRDLILRANHLFPLHPYLEPQAVRGARRSWIRSVMRLRETGALRQDEFVRSVNKKAALKAMRAAAKAVSTVH